MELTLLAFIQKKVRHRRHQRQSINSLRPVNINENHNMLTHGYSQPRIFDAERLECVACGSSAIAPWKKKQKDNVVFAIWRCLDCETGFLNPPPNLDWLKSVYARSGHGLTCPISLEDILVNESEFPNSTIDAERMIGRAATLLPAGASAALHAFDIGSGYGFFSAAALRYGFTVTAINPSKWENDVFEHMNHFRPIEAIFEESDIYDKLEMFNLVIMSQVLEHIHDPFTLISHVNKLLKSDGVVAIAVPNFKSIRVKILGERDNSCLWVPEHLTYFTFNGLEQLLRRAGFGIVEYRSVGRIPSYRVSNKLKLGGVFRTVTNTIIQYGQLAPLFFCNVLGMGFYLNVWAKKSKTSVNEKTR